MSTDTARDAGAARDADPAGDAATHSREDVPGEHAHAGAPGMDTVQRLAPKAVTMWRLNATLTSASIALAALVAEFLVGVPWRPGLVSFAWALVALAYVVVVPPMRYRAWSYQLRERDLYLRHGILFRTTSIVPHARIQHVDTRHGPVDRWLGLSEVVVYTAGIRGASIPIPALSSATAESLRDALAALSGSGDAV
ncbi:MAG TPA: PH domain-containing protein [Longimicrobiales bacterium]|nr:PH domain-containing protein [Longimicrobiales bacterium]